MSPVHDVIKCLGTWSVDSDRDFFVDVFLNHSTNTLEAWLYHASYGFKTLMFGFSWFNEDPSGFLALVEDKVCDYIELYRKGAFYV